MVDDVLLLDPTARGIDGGDGPPARHRRWPRVLPAVLAFLLVGGLLGIGMLQNGGGATGAPRRTGGPAPDFALTSFDGAPIRLAELRGTPVVMNFWASWCPPCREEAAALQAVAGAEAGEALFLGIDVRDRDSDARAFIDEFDIEYANAPDTAGVHERYGAVGLPFTVFVARDGTIARTWIGPLDEQQLLAFVEELV